MFDGLGLTTTAAEKVRQAFADKKGSVVKHGDSLSLHEYATLYGRLHHGLFDDWMAYLSGVEGVEYIRKFSNLAEPLDYLLEEINKGEFNRYVVRCPVIEHNFIILTKEAVERILVLGLP